MTEAVIVAYGRSPIGRARKGSLVDVRPDDLAAHVVNKVLDKVPQLDPTEIEDLICGCGLPGGEQGHNIGRVVSILSRLDVPGVTVNRYCSSSLMTTRMATHAIEAGEGDVFLSVGVECVSRYGSGYPDAPDTYNPRLVPGNAEEYPDIYIAMGQTAENVARREKIGREEQDRYAVKSQAAAVKAREDDDRRHRHRRDQRSFRRPGHPLSEGHRRRPVQRQAQPPRRRDRARPPVWNDGRPHPMHPAQRLAREGQDLRPGNDVRGRWPGHGNDRGTLELMPGRNTSGSPRNRRYRGVDSMAMIVLRLN